MGFLSAMLTILGFVSQIILLCFSYETIPLFLQKQSDLLLNADDLDAMWVCLRENCVIDDATGAEKVSSISFFLVCYLTMCNLSH